MVDYFILAHGLGFRFLRAWLQEKGPGASESLHLVIDHFWSRPGIVPYLQAPAEIRIEPYEVGTIYVDDNGEKTTLFKWPKNFYRMKKGEYEPAVEHLREVLAALPAAMKKCR
jgi:hypothetical protein